jgi:hypothetical protein
MPHMIFRNGRMLDLDGVQLPDGRRLRSLDRDPTVTRNLVERELLRFKVPGIRPGQGLDGMIETFADWQSKQLEYIRWAQDVVSGLRGASRSLEEEFDRAVSDAERSVHVPNKR